MPSLFESKKGYVLMLHEPSMIKALLSLDSELRSNVIFISSLGIQQGVNHSVSYSLDNRIFLSAAGDRLGSIRLLGLAFDAACQQEDGKTSGFQELTKYYKDNKLQGSKEKPVVVKISYASEQHVGILSGFSANTSPVAQFAMSFSLDFLLIP